MEHPKRKGKAVSGMLVFPLVLLLCALPGCGGRDRNAHISSQIGGSLPSRAEIKYSDTHGGNGDGDLYAVVSFPDDAAAQFSDSLAKAGWQTKLPDDMVPWFYGGNITAEGKSSSTDGYFHDMKIDVPEVKDGYFFYRDRYREQYGEPCSYAPYTQNFTIAIFDSGHSTLYFLEGDS